jgi:hypothetical protein
VIRASANGSPPRSEFEDAPLVSWRVRASAGVYAIVVLALVVTLPVHRALQLLVWVTAAALVLYVLGFVWLMVTEVQRQRYADLQKLWERMQLSDSGAGRDRLRAELEAGLVGLSQRRMRRWHATGHGWPED